VRTGTPRQPSSGTRVTDASGGAALPGDATTDMCAIPCNPHTVLYFRDHTAVLCAPLLSSRCTAAPIPAQPSSTLYVQGLAPSITKKNFHSLLPEAAKQDLASFRVVMNGIAFLEYDGVGPAKEALVCLRAAKDTFGDDAVFEFAKSRGGRSM
jgi:hypothetical protein